MLEFKKLVLPRWNRKKEKEKRKEDFQDHLLCIKFFCSVIEGKKGGVFHSVGLHNELRKVNESEPVQFTTLS